MGGVQLISKSTFLAASLVLASLVATPCAAAQPCHWWQFGHCDKQSAVEGLPADAPRTGTVITIDRSTNLAYLFKDGQLIRKSAAATGSNKSLVHGDDEWYFETPVGHRKAKRKIVDPVWRTPDWAFIEAGEA